MENLMNLRVYKAASGNPNPFQQVNRLRFFQNRNQQRNKQKKKKLKSSERRCNPRVLYEANFIKIQKSFSGNTAPTTSFWNKTKQSNKTPHCVKIEPNKIESK